MPRIIVQQPDGKYAVWSTVVDNFVCQDMTRDELKDFFVEEAVEQARQEVDRQLSRIAEGKTTYTYEQCLNLIREIHGK
jgi:hypothetical protein